MEGCDRKEEDYIRRWTSWKMTQVIWEKKEELLVLWINLNKYKNFSSSDLTEESYSFQIVFSYLFSTNPIHCDLDIIYWVFYLWNPSSNKYIVLDLLGHHPFPFQLGWGYKSSSYSDNINTKKKNTHTHTHMYPFYFLLDTRMRLISSTKFAILSLAV